MQRVEGHIRDCVASLDLSKVDWSEVLDGVDGRHICKSVVLKPTVGPNEKGVVFVSFEDEWARLLWGCDLSEFSRRYYLVVAPSWSPPHGVVNCTFPAAYPDPIFCLISNPHDLEIFPRLSAKYSMVPLFASSWVNPALYKPVPFEQKDIDLLMVASFEEYKRHFLLFKALRTMPASTRVLLIGQDHEGRTAESIMSEARAYGVQDRFELRVNAPHTTVLEALCRAKTTVVLSRREGSCVAVVESMFANTPVGVFEDAEVGSRVHINEATGRLLRYRDLGRQLSDFAANADKYSPRAWAERNISCSHSTHVLNEAVKAHALESGQEWTQDIAAHDWRPNPQLISTQDQARMQGSYDDFLSRFGIRLGPI